jgi:hypothetical protein
MIANSKEHQWAAQQSHQVMWLKHYELDTINTSNDMAHVPTFGELPGACLDFVHNQKNSSATIALRSLNILSLSKGI